MVKLFITLYLMVLASFFLFIAMTFSIVTIGESISQNIIIEGKLAKGVFTLLDESVMGLDKTQIDARLRNYKEVFGGEFKLVDYSTLNFDQKELEEIANGDILLRKESRTFITKLEEDQETDDKLSILFAKLNDTSQVWRVSLDFNLDVTVNDSGFHAIVTNDKYYAGLMYLIRLKLLEEDKSEWQSALITLRRQFGFPISVKDSISLKELNSFLDDNEKEDIITSIEEGKVGNITMGTSNTTLIQKIPSSSQYISIGPITTPWFIRNIIYIVLLLFLLSFATMVLLWVWPLWLNLIRLKKASDKFGDGSYDARIPYKRLSPIKNISKAFNAMAEHTQSSIHSQKELTSAVSHELRTPVARMRFALEMLNASDNKKEQTRYAEALNEDINELDLLLEELLNYARFDQNNLKLNFSIVKLIPWLDHSMQKLLPLANEKTLIYKVKNIKENETNHFEPRLMSRVLDNLVQNALRYAKRKVEVTLERTGDYYLLVVEDDGEGIPEEKREYIFDAFSRIDASRDRASGGFGLGLAIVNRIVKSHHGSVSIHTSYLGGAQFEVRLPCGK